MAEPVRTRRLSDQEGQRLQQIVRRGKHRPAAIGRERLRQILHARGISFQRTRTWKESTDPDRDAKLHPVRLRATCHRTHGIRYFHGCYGIGDDQLWGVVRERKGADHTLAALKSIRAARPGGYRLFVIMDNLSANKTPAIRRWAQRQNAEVCFTPASA